jgi:hypothetical protein
LFISIFKKNKFMKLIKNYAVILTMILSCNILFAQSIQVFVSDSSKTESTSVSTISIQANVKNNSANNLNVIVSKEVIQEAEDALIYFCWGACYTPAVSLSNDVIAISSGATEKDNFAAYSEPQGKEGVSIVKYCFMDQSNQTDSSCVTLRFISSNATSISEIHNDKLGANLYPNPAKNLTHLSYQISSNNGKVVVYDVLGQQIFTDKLNSTIGLLTLDLSSVNEGVYFYSLYDENNLIETKKFIVSK